MNTHVWKSLAPYGQIPSYSIFDEPMELDLLV